MPNWTADEDMPLDRFLRQKKYQQWRIPILATCGGVKIIRSGSEVRLSDEKTRVKSGDTVRVSDPLSSACEQSMLASAKANGRDYAFVPGTTRYDVDMGKLMEARPQTIRIKDPFIDNLTSFVRALESGQLITSPVRNVIVASHSNPEGHLFIAVGVIAAKTITYEDLEAAATSSSIRLNESLFLPRPTDAKGAAIPPQFLFRGCRIGSQPEFMKKLKQALGNKVTVVAPKHFHIVAQFSNPPGYMEYMGYNFAIAKPKQLKDKNAVVAAFTAAKGFQRIDGKDVPPNLWNQWIPNQPNLPGTHSYDNFVVQPITKSRDNAPRHFRYLERKMLDKKGSIALPIDTGKIDDRKDAIKVELLKVDRYKASHPFPEYKRFGYQSLAEYMDGWDWDFEYDKSSKTLYYNAKRHEYTLIQPITEITSNELVMNFYPTTKKGSVLELLNTNDSRFFASF